jgi:hypothetical protein
MPHEFRHTANLGNGLAQNEIKLKTTDRHNQGATERLTAKQKWLCHLTAGLFRAVLIMAITIFPVIIRTGMISLDRV